MTTVIEHLPGYQERDQEIVDYQMYGLDQTRLWFRGPKPEKLSPGQYFACIGAAQTFGCFCQEPFPSLLQSEIRLPGLNLGYGGAGPYFYLKHPELLDYLNQAKFVIVQVMSGRSESNSLFDSGGLEFLTRRTDGVKLGADEAYRQVLQGNSIWQRIPIGQRYTRRIASLLATGAVKELVAETRENWVNHYRLLLSQIKVPKVLLWFSKRSPDYQEKYTSLDALFDDFPQLVNLEMVKSIRQYSDDYVECISCKGSPQRLISRFTGEATTIDPASDRKDLGGKLWTHNSYYPSPEMHRDAVNLLTPTLRKYL